MKKTIFYVSVLAVLFSVVSCGNDDERIRKEIIGSYSYNNTNEKGVISGVIEGVETFNEDGTVENVSIIDIHLSREDIGNIHFKYRMEMWGGYEIENEYIIYDYDDIERNSSLELLSVESTDGDGEFIQQFQEQLERDLFPLMRDGFVDANAADIYELTEERLVILNPEGEKIIKTRIVE